MKEFNVTFLTINNEGDLIPSYSITIESKNATELSDSILEEDYLATDDIIINTSKFAVIEIEEIEVSA